MARILVAGDAPHIVDPVCEAVDEAGHSAVSDKGKPDVRRILERERFDVMIAVIPLAGMEVEDLLSRVRQLNPRLPVILFASDPSIQTAAEAVRGGAFDYLTPPLAPKCLVDAVGNALVVRAQRNEQARVAAQLRDHDPRAVAESACSRLTRRMGYRYAWLIRMDRDGRPVSVHTAGLAASPGQTADRFRSRALSGWWPPCSRGVWESSRTTATRSGQMDCKPCDLAELCNGHVVFTRALAMNERCLGVLGAALPTSCGDSAQDLDVFDGLSHDLGYAFYRLDLEARYGAIRREYDELFQAISDGLAIYRPTEGGQDFILDDVNEAGLAMVGGSRDSLAGRRVTELFPKAGQSGLLELFRRVWHSGRPERHGPARLGGNCDGRWYTHHVNRFSGGGMVAVFEDVTDLVLRTERLAASEERFRALMEQAADAMILHDLDGRIADANPYAVSTYGYSRDELLDMHMRGLDPAFEDRDRGGAFWEELEPYEPVYFESRQLRKDGTVFPVDVHLSLIHLEGDTLVLWICRDTSELMRAKARLELALQFSEIGLWDWNPRTGDLYVSDEFRQQLGFGTHDPVRTREDWIRRVHPEDRERVLENMQACISGDAADYHAEFRMQHKDGTWRWIQARGEAMHDAHGCAQRVLGCHLDITERRRAEQERLAMESQLRQTQKMEAIGTLASGVAHEINNPINGIMNYAQLIKDQPDDPAQSSDFAHEIIHETQRVASIVRNLLAFARHPEPSLAEASVKDMAQRTLSLLQTVLRHDGIHVVVDIPDGLPPVHCNVQEIQQVVMNLLTNARDALNDAFEGRHPDKVLRLHARVIAADDGSRVRLTIEDRGVGVKKEVRARMFEPFYTTKGRDRGSGMGLTISYNILKEHHGELHVESEVGEYTRFHMDLPVTKDS